MLDGRKTIEKRTKNYSFRKQNKNLKRNHKSNFMKIKKGKVPKVMIGEGFVFFFFFRRRNAKEFEHHWANETSEEEGQIMQRKYSKKEC